MKIKKYKSHFSTVVGSVNCYLCYNLNDAFIIDIGGSNVIDIINKIKFDNKALKAVLITHGHFDHFYGLSKLKQNFDNFDVIIGKEDYEFLFDSKFNLSNIYKEKVLLEKNNFNIIKVNEKFEKIFKFEIIDIPGHTIGSKAYYLRKENICFSGDFIFETRFGKTNFPTSCYNSTLESLENLKKISKCMHIYPGHGKNFILKKWRQNETGIMEC